MLTYGYVEGAPGDLLLREPCAHQPVAGIEGMRENFYMGKHAAAAFPWVISILAGIGGWAFGWLLPQAETISGLVWAVLGLLVLWIVYRAAVKYGWL